MFAGAVIYCNVCFVCKSKQDICLCTLTSLDGRSVCCGKAKYNSVTELMREFTDGFDSFIHSWATNRTFYKQQVMSNIITRPFSVPYSSVWGLYPTARWDVDQNIVSNHLALPSLTLIMVRHNLAKSPTAPSLIPTEAQPWRHSSTIIVNITNSHRLKRTLSNHLSHREIHLKACAIVVLEPNYLGRTGIQTMARGGGTLLKSSMHCVTPAIRWDIFWNTTEIFVDDHPDAINGSYKNQEVIQWELKQGHLAENTQP